MTINNFMRMAFLSCFTAIFMACNTENKNMNSADTLSSRPDSASFQKELHGKKVSLYKIRSGQVTAYFTNYGARLVSLVVPDRNKKPTDIVVGFGSIDGYLNSTEPYFGATIGRYGNRIAKGHFSIDGQDYQISLNNGQNALHGGKNGFQAVVWDVKQPDEKTLVFTYLSKDGEEGFPGTLTTVVTYSLNNEQELRMAYEATSDKKTVVNLTNHAFFNLNGEGSGNVLGHKVQIFADKYNPVDSTLIPSGELAPVANTPFDFTNPKTIGERIDADDAQLNYGRGYDHNYVLSGKRKDMITHAATVTGNISGIVMDIFTMEPGMQFYSGNFMAGKNTFKTGVKDEFRTAFAMETQHFPDSPNQPSFPTTVLNPGDKYQTVSIYKFSAKK